MGEQLASFGAFLGRPFREYDFYSGIYDGLEFVASNFVCGHLTNSTPAHKTCTESVHSDLIDGNVFQLSDHALAVSTWHRDEEYGVLQSQYAIVSFDTANHVDVNRAVLLSGLHRELLRLKKQAGPIQGCKKRNDLVGSAICPSGLGGVLKNLSADTLFKSAADSLRRLCRVDVAASLPEACIADDEFIELLNSPKRYLNELAERALSNLHDAEDGIRATYLDLPQYSATVELIFSHYRASTFRYRRGFYGIEINPSSARMDGRKPSRMAGSAAAIILPNYITFLGGGRVRDCRERCESTHALKATSITAGWRPVVIRLGEHIYLASRFELSRYQNLADGTESPKRFDNVFGASIGTHSWTPPGFSSIEVGWLGGRHLVHQELQPTRGRLNIAQVSGRLFGEKLQVDLRWNARRAFTTSIGVSDLNGLLYWWFR